MPISGNIILDIIVILLIIIPFTLICWYLNEKGWRPNVWRTKRNLLKYLIIYVTVSLCIYAYIYYKNRNRTEETKKGCKSSQLWEECLASLPVDSTSYEKGKIAISVMNWDERQGIMKYEGIFFIDPQTWSVKKIPGMEDKYDFGISWSPNGNMIAVAIKKDIDKDGVINMSCDVEDIFILSLDGRELFNVSKIVNNYSDDHSLSGVFRHVNVEPTWSPDAKKIAFIRCTPPEGIFVVNLYTNEFERILPSRVISANENLDTLFYENVKWSPDGKKLAIMSCTIFRTESEDITNRRIAVYYFDTGDIQYLTSTNEECSNPSWTLDSKSIIFQKINGTTKLYNKDRTKFQITPTYDIFIMTLNGKNVENLTNTPELSEMIPCCSPDGKQIAFVTFHADLWFMNIDGTEKRKISQIEELIDEIAWSFK